MKRIFSILLIFVFVFSFSIPSHATTSVYTGDYKKKLSTDKSVYSKFVVGKHDFAFKNSNTGYYISSSSGRCSGFALASLISYYGVMPKSMKADSTFIKYAKEKGFKNIPSKGDYVYDLKGDYRFYNSSNLYALKAPTPEDQKAIDYWWLQAQENVSQKYWTQQFELTAFKNRLSDSLVDKIIKPIQKGNPVLIGLKSAHEGGHNVIVYGYGVKNDKYGKPIGYNLYIADSNFPGSKNEYIILTKQKDGWSYYWPKYGSYYFADSDKFKLNSGRMFSVFNYDLYKKEKLK